MTGESRPRALVADDARVMRMLLRTWLERLGVDVTEAATGLEALVCLQNQPLDVAFLDVHMPGMSGLQLLDQVRNDARLGALPIVIVTTLGHQADVERAMKIGATAYLTKPLGYRELVEALHTALPTATLRRRPTPLT